TPPGWLPTNPGTDPSAQSDPGKNGSRSACRPSSTSKPGPAHKPDTASTHASVPATSARNDTCCDTSSGAVNAAQFATATAEPEAAARTTTIAARTSPPSIFATRGCAAHNPRPEPPNSTISSGPKS